MNSDDLLKLAKDFQKLAEVDFNALCKNYGYAIGTEASTALQVIDNMINDPKFAKSATLATLKHLFQNILKSSKELTPSNLNIVLEDLKSNIGNGTFLTSSSNTGTGFDPVSRIGGAASPGAYLTRIQAYVSTIDKMVSYKENLTKKVNPYKGDPTLHHK